MNRLSTNQREIIYFVILIPMRNWNSFPQLQWTFETVRRIEFLNARLRTNVPNYVTSTREVYDKIWPINTITHHQ